MRLLVGHALSYASGFAAVEYHQARFSRVMTAGGTGVLSSVTQSSDSLVASSSGTRSIASIVVSAVEASEYSVQVAVVVDLSGSSVDIGSAVADIEIIWSGFLTAPTIV